MGVQRLFAELELARQRFVNGEDPEALEDFRMALRSVRTVLRATKATLKVQAGLRHIADLTTSLRDEEMIDALIEALPLPEPERKKLREWYERREKARRRELARARREAASQGLRSILGEARQQLASTKLDAKRFNVARKAQDALSFIHDIDIAIETARHAGGASSRALVGRLKELRRESMAQAREVLTALRVKAR